MASDNNGAGGADDEPPIEVKVTDHRSASKLEDDEPPLGDGKPDESIDAVAELEAQVAQLEGRRQELLNRLTRVQADFANYRRRTSEEAQEIAQFANQAFALEMLSVLDAFERAFSALPSELRMLTWIDGVGLIQAQLSRVLETAGVTSIECRVGDPIDVAIHDVVMTEGDKAAAVAAVLQPGYRMHDRVIRPVLIKAGPLPEDTQPSGDDADVPITPPNDSSEVV